MFVQLLVRLATPESAETFAEGVSIMLRNMPVWMTWSALLLAIAFQQACSRPFNTDFVPPHGAGPLFRRDAVEAYVVQHNNTISESVKECFDRKISADESVEILALSGGGQWGAYGAGFLRAWRNHGRPRFDIVTGVSTGALQATFAFLDTDEADRLLECAYGIESPGDVARIKVPLLPWSESLMDSTPLRERLSSYITLEVLRDVAAEHRKGRRLFVGSVNTDLGVFWTWDLGRIALAEDEAARTRFIDCLMASAAIPVAFAPVYIDGFQHVDGGTMRNVFIETIKIEIQQRQQDPSSRAADRPPAAVHVYLLLNGKVEERGEFTRTDFIRTGLRSLNLLMSERMVGNVYRAFLEAQGTEGVLTFRIHSIPRDACDGSDETRKPTGAAEHSFDPKQMRCLNVQGRAAFEHQPVWFCDIASWEARTKPPLSTPDQEVRAAQGAAERP